MLLVGSVDLDTENFADALAELRQTAIKEAGEDFTTKLVIPDDQLKFLEVKTGNVSELARMKAARSSLIGATPYALEDLAFDIASDGDATYVAAVAKETLNEAEEFAAEHGFNPIYLVGQIREGGADTAAFFGATSRFLAQHPDHSLAPDHGGLLVTLAAPARAKNDTELHVAMEAVVRRPAKEAPPPQVKPVGPSDITFTAVAKQSAARAEPQPKPQESQTKNKPAKKRGYLPVAIAASALLTIGFAAWQQGLISVSGSDPAQTASTSDDAPLAPPTPSETELDSDILHASLFEDLPPPSHISSQPEFEEPGAPELHQTAEYDPRAASRFYAATGVWIAAPPMFDAPKIIGLEALNAQQLQPKTDHYDPVALLPVRGFITDHYVSPPSSPPAAGTRFNFNARGLVQPTPEGTRSPENILVFMGRPGVVPPERPRRAASAENTGGEDSDALMRPRARPENFVELLERQRYGGLSRAEFGGLRPQMRPETAKSEAENAEAETPDSPVANSMRPAARPDGFNKRVAAALAAAPEPEPEESQSTASLGPIIPSRASVTEQATIKRAINLRKINLLGVVGRPTDRSALVRFSNGRVRKVQVGDRLNGGRVLAIGDTELRYQKGSQNIVLRMPRT